jgi:predicted phage-related endonuclease
MTGIGGSDVGAIVGVDPYRNALDVYLDKIGEREPDEPTGVQQAGTALEPIIRDLYKQHTGRKLKPARFRRHKQHKWMIGHPDALVCAVEDPKDPTDERGVLECKSMLGGSFKKVVEKGLPKHIQLQGYHYGALCEHDWVAFAILARDQWRFVEVQVEIDKALQQQAIEICEHFWYNHVVPRDPPKPRDPEWAIELPEVPVDSIDGLSIIKRQDADWQRAIESVREMKLIADDAKQLYEEAREKLRETCGGFGVFEGSGARVYFRELSRKGSLDQKLMKAHGLLDPALAAVQVQLAIAEAKLNIGAEAEADLCDQIEMKLYEEARADLESFRKPETKYKDLRVYHAVDQEDK